MLSVTQRNEEIPRASVAAKITESIIRTGRQEGGNFSPTWQKGDLFNTGIDVDLARTGSRWSYTFAARCRHADSVID
jgi:hypothetical protein